MSVPQWLCPGLRAWLTGDGPTPRWVLLGVALAAVLAAGLLGKTWLGWVATQGWELREANPARDWLLGFIWALVLGGALSVAPLPRAHRRPLLVAWAAKVAVVLGFMLVYEAHYGTSLDAVWYFLNSNPQTFVWQGFLPNHGTENITTLAWLQSLALPQSYHALKISSAMVGLVGIYFFYRAFALFLRHDQPVLLLALALFPSILFWSSILGKDPLVLASLGGSVWGIVGLWRSQSVRLRYLLGLAAGLVGLLYLRPWLIPILVLASGPLLTHEARVVLRTRGLADHTIQAILALGLLSVTMASVALLAELFGLTSVAGTVSFVNSLARAWAEGGSGQQPPEFHSLGDMLLFLPWGAFTALFRPLPGEITNPLLFGTLAGLENGLLVALAALAVRRARRADFREPLIVAGLWFVLIWTVLYSFVSYQNLGSAERFRLQVMPVMLGLLVFLARPRNAPDSKLAAWLRPSRSRLHGVNGAETSFPVVKSEVAESPPAPRANTDSPRLGHEATKAGVRVRDASGLSEKCIKKGVLP